MEDEPSVERFEEYCIKSEGQDIGYAVKVKYIDLINYVKSQCKYKNSTFYYGLLRHYHLNWGIINYEDLDNEELRKHISRKHIFEEMHTFYKNKNKFEHEKEFRLKLTIAGGVYRPIKNNFRRQGKADHLQFMPRFEEKCGYTLYKYSRNTGIQIVL